MEHLNLYTDFLREEGYAPKTTDDGSVQFKFEGRTFYLDVEENDKQYFRLSKVIWDLEDETVDLKVFKITNEVSAGAKLAKLYITRNRYIWVSVEMLIDSTPNLGDFFFRIIGIINYAEQRFLEKIKETVPDEN